MTAARLNSLIQLVPATRSAPVVGGGVQIAGPLEAPGTVNLPAELYPPANATTFNLSANQAVFGPGATFTPAGLHLQLPSDCYGVISAVELLLDGIVLATNVTWAILAQNAAVPGWNNISILGRNGAASVSKSWDGPLRLMIPLGGFIDVQITDVDGGAYTAGTSLYGWFWPQARG